MAKTVTDISKIVYNKMSQAKYDALAQSGELDDTQFYITPDKEYAKTLDNPSHDTAPSTKTIVNLINNLYPVGTIYYGVQDTCPLETIITGSKWIKISTNILISQDSTSTMLPMNVWQRNA